MGTLTERPTEPRKPRLPSVIASIPAERRLTREAPRRGFLLPAILLVVAVSLILCHGCHPGGHDDDLGLFSHPRRDEQHKTNEPRGN